jgi:hypothetical protein
VSGKATARAGGGRLSRERPEPRWRLSFRVFRGRFRMARRFLRNFRRDHSLSRRDQSLARRDESLFRRDQYLGGLGRRLHTTAHRPLFWARPTTAGPGWGEVALTSGRVRRWSGGRFAACPRRRHGSFAKRSIDSSRPKRRRSRGCGTAGPPARRLCPPGLADIPCTRRTWGRRGSKQEGDTA